MMKASSARRQRSHFSGKTLTGSFITAETPTRLPSSTDIQAKMPEEFIISFYITHRLSPSPSHMTCQRLTPDRLDSAFRLPACCYANSRGERRSWWEMFLISSPRVCTSVSPPYTVIRHLKILSFSPPLWPRYLCEDIPFTPTCLNPKIQVRTSVIFLKLLINLMALWSWTIHTIVAEKTSYFCRNYVWFFFK